MCPGSNRTGLREAARLITREIKKSISVVLACMLWAVSQGSLDQWAGRTLLPSVMVASNSLSQWAVSNPLVQTCLTSRGFETQGLDLQRPSWSPNLQARGQGSPQGRFLFLRALVVQKGHPFWGPALSVGAEGSEHGSKAGRRRSTLSRRATNPLHTASGLAPLTQVPLSGCLWGCPYVALGTFP